MELRQPMRPAHDGNWAAGSDEGAEGRNLGQLDGLGAIVALISMQGRTGWGSAFSKLQLAVTDLQHSMQHSILPHAPRGIDQCFAAWGPRPAVGPFFTMGAPVGGKQWQ